MGNAAGNRSQDVRVVRSSCSFPALGLQEQQEQWPKLEACLQKKPAKPACNSTFSSGRAIYHHLPKVRRARPCSGALNPAKSCRIRWLPGQFVRTRSHQDQEAEGSREGQGKPQRMRRAPVVCLGGIALKLPFAKFCFVSSAPLTSPMCWHMCAFRVLPGPWERQSREREPFKCPQPLARTLRFLRLKQVSSAGFARPCYVVQLRGPAETKPDASLTPESSMLGTGGTITLAVAAVCHETQSRYFEAPTR